MVPLRKSLLSLICSSSDNFWFAIIFSINLFRTTYFNLNIISIHLPFGEVGIAFRNSGRGRMVFALPENGSPIYLPFGEVGIAFRNSGRGEGRLLQINQYPPDIYWTTEGL